MKAAPMLVWDSQHSRVRMRRRGEVVFDNQLVRDLVAMRHAGELKAVWIDEGEISVRMNHQHELEAPMWLSLGQVHQMIEDWKRTKAFVRFPPKSEIARERNKGKLRR